MDETDSRTISSAAARSNPEAPVPLPGRLVAELAPAPDRGPFFADEFAAPVPLLTFTFAPSSSLSNPLVAITSPGCTPCTAATFPSVVPTVTVCIAAVWLDLMTYTKVPCAFR